MPKQRDIIRTIVNSAIEDAVGDVEVSKESIEAVLTGEIDSHSHPNSGEGLTQSQILTRQL